MVQVKTTDRGITHIVEEVIQLRPKRESKRKSEMFGKDLDLSTTNTHLRVTAVDYIADALQNNPEMKKDKNEIREIFMETVNKNPTHLVNSAKSQLKSHKAQVEAYGEELKAANVGIEKCLHNLGDMIGKMTLAIFFYKF